MKSKMLYSKYINIMYGKEFFYFGGGPKAYPQNPVKFLIHFEYFVS